MERLEEEISFFTAVMLFSVLETKHSIEYISLIDLMIHCHTFFPFRTVMIAVIVNCHVALVA